MPPKRTRAAPAKFTWRAREVVQTVDHKPHLVVQISVTGGVFPQRALVPIMRTIQGKKVVAYSWYTEISNDGRTLLGHFATDVPAQGTVEFGYPDQLGRASAKFQAKSIKRLDRKRLGRDVVDVTTEYLKRKRGY